MDNQILKMCLKKMSSLFSKNQKNYFNHKNVCLLQSWMGKLRLEKQPLKYKIITKHSALEVWYYYIQKDSDFWVHFAIQEDKFCVYCSMQCDIFIFNLLLSLNLEILPRVRPFIELYKTMLYLNLSKVEV